MSEQQIKQTNVDSEYAIIDLLTEDDNSPVLLVDEVSTKKKLILKMASQKADRRNLRREYKI